MNYKSDIPIPFSNPILLLHSQKIKFKTSYRTFSLQSQLSSSSLDTTINRNYFLFCRIDSKSNKASKGNSDYAIPHPQNKKTHSAFHFFSIVFIPDYITQPEQF